MRHRSVHVGFVVVLLLSVFVQSINAPATWAAASLAQLLGSGSQTGGKSIQLKVRISEPAPSGGATVSLSSSSAAIETPATLTVPAGQIEQLISVPTNPVASNESVTVSATYLGVTKSRSVLIKAPVLTSIGVQTVIRHGGMGKVIVRLSGPAPAGGFAVTTSTDPSGHLLLDNPVTVPAGESQVSLKVSASLFETAGVIELLPDLPLSVTISAGSATFTRSTVIRDFGDDPRPTATNTATTTSTSTVTATATETATPTVTATSTASSTPTETATSTAIPPTSTPSSTPTVTSTPTITSTPDPVSPSCRAIINGALDSESDFQNLDDADFNNGDTISWIATGNTSNLIIRFRNVSGSSRDYTSATGSHVITSAETFRDIGMNSSEDVTWDFSCTPGSP